MFSNSAIFMCEPTTLYREEPVLGPFANSADRVKMPQDRASDHVQHSLLTGISAQNTIKVKT